MQDLRLLELLKYAEYRGIRILAVIDLAAMEYNRTSHELKMSTVTKQLGVYVADGAIPLEEFRNFEASNDD